MARLARTVAPGFPHHIAQRGNRRQQAFFCDENYQRHVELMAEWCNALEVEILAYCLVPNHVHLKQYRNLPMAETRPQEEAAELGMAALQSQIWWPGIPGKTCRSKCGVRRPAHNGVFEAPEV
jgi:Transposase IS200 like